MKKFEAEKFESEKSTNRKVEAEKFESEKSEDGKIRGEKRRTDKFKSDNLKSVSDKFSKIVASIITLVFFTSLIVGASISKYVVEEKAPFGDEEYVDYTVNSVFVVRTQDELFEAINQGYTYVQLDKEIENPLIVTQKAETLNSDLILDLNGIEIQRNGYDPILNVKDGVRLTIVDTSDEQTGGLYNPVGSVFNIVGGTLTVVTGNFESGPRYSEYYSYNESVLKDTDPTKRTLVENEPQTVNYYQKNSSGIFDSVGEKTAPIIKSYPTTTGEIEYTHGNLYFDEVVALSNSDLTIYPDTYCYYRTSEDSAKDATDVSMADWYYSYYVKANGYDYVGKSLPQGGNASDYIEVTIYGYENVINQARNMKNQADYYAAIQMSKGTLDVQKGSFYQYFGVETTACVNSQGGEINVKHGDFSVRVPDATTFSQNTVGEKESDQKAFGENYFTNFKWKASSGYNAVSGEYVGNLAKNGESFCILNGGNAKITINSGNLYSSNNNVIGMQGGSLTVHEGSFTKKIVNPTANSSSVKDDSKLSAVSMKNGSLTISKATCKITGDFGTGILINAGTLAVNDSEFTIIGSSGNGIYSSIQSTTAFTVQNTAFKVEGNNATGIYSEKGRVNLSATGSVNSKISTKGISSYGIRIKDGGSVSSSNYDYEISGDGSIGIFADSDASGIKVLNGSMTVEGNDSFGIKSRLTTNLATTDGVSGQFTITDFSVSMPLGGTISYSNQTGIYSENGTVTLSATSVSFIKIEGEEAKGIHVANGGSVSSSNYDYQLNGSKSYGIYSESGTVTLDNGNLKLTSNDKCYGVYAVSSETITINLTSVSVNVGYIDGTATAKNSDTSASAGVFLSSLSADSTVKLNACDVKSFELGVVSNGGSVTMTGTGSIQTNMASAIAIRSGDVTFAEGSKYDITSFNTTTSASTNGYQMTLPVRNGKDIVDTKYVNTDGIYVNGGSFTSKGDLTVTHTGLQNAQSDPNGNIYNYNSLVVTSYAVRVLGGNVNIEEAKITAVIGGGVYAGKTDVNGVEQVGNVTLGKKNVNDKNITVQANGDSVGELYYALGDRNIGPQWQNYKSITGGHAIELNGGNITVYYGTYEAQVGNGVYANGNGSITVYGGTFKGFMNDGKNHTRSGPSSYYGLKVVGGATVNIYDGIFDGGNGGGFVTGVTSLNMYSNTTTINSSETAHVYIYKGTFGHDASVDSFNVYDDAIVVFGAGGKDYFGETATADDFKEAIVLYASNASIAANGIAQNYSSNKKAEIYVYYGTYNGACTWLDGYCHSETFYATYNKQLGYTYATYDMHGEQEKTSAVFYS